MSNTLQIKRRTSAGVPSGLAAGELAVNLSDNKLYVGNAAENGVIHLNPSASTSYLPLAGGELTGTVDSHVNDVGVILKSGNTSATGTPDQFFLKHNYGNVDIGNSRGHVNFSAGTLKYGGNEVFTVAGGTLGGTLTLDTSLTLKDGSGAAVGALTILGGNNLTISGSQTNHCGLSFATNAILPATQGATNTGTVDLGASSEKFKNLYLSGTITATGGILTSTSQPVLKTAYNADHFLGIGHHYIDLNFSSYTNDLELRTGGTPRLTIHRSTGNATFSGTITATGGTLTGSLGVTGWATLGSGGDFGRLALENNNTTAGTTYLQQTYSGTPELRIGSNVGTHANASLIIKSGNAAEVKAQGNLTVGGTTSTFGTNGSIILKDPYAANDAALEIKRDAGANSSILLHGEGDSYIANGITGGLAVGSTSPSGFKFQVAGTAKITSDLTVGGNLTVTGTISAGSNADTLDNLDSTQFLRSDASDTASGDTYTFSSGSTAIRMSFTGHAGAAYYNYFLNAYNDGGLKAVHFVNGSTRTADGGANAYTIRNDGGKLILGRTNQITDILGSAVSVTGNLTGSATLGTNASRWSTIYGAAGDFSGNLTVSGSCTFAAVSGTTATFSGNINGNHLTLTNGAILTNHSSHNNYGFQIKSNDANQSALEFEDSGNNWLGTLYAAKSGSTKYIGFLDAPWGSWDVKKTVNGALEIDQGSGLETVLTTTGGTLTGNLTVGGSVYINDTNTRLHEGGSNSVRLQTNSGYVDVGPMNADYAHLQTDRNRFYFNRELVVDSGIIRSYNEDLQFDASYSGAVAKNIILRTGNVEKIRMDTDGAFLINTTSKSSGTGKFYVGAPLASSSSATAQISGLLRTNNIITHDTGTGASAYAGIQPNTNNTGNVGNTSFRYYGAYFNVGDFSGKVKSTSYQTTHTFEWSGRTATFAHGSSGLVSKLNFGNEQIWGWIEVTLTDAYNYAPTTGKLTRLYEIGHNQSTAYNYANGKVTESYGTVNGQWRLGDLELVGNNVTIPIIHRTTSGNQVAVHVRGMIHGTNAASILNNLSLSSPAVGSYSTDVQFAEIADMKMSGTNGRIRNDSGNTIIDHDGELVRIPGIAVNHSTPGTHGLYVKDKTSYLKGNVGINATPSGNHALYLTSGSQYTRAYLSQTADIHIANTSGSGVGSYAGAISFCSTAEANLQAASIAAIQTGSDQNQIGLTFNTQVSTAGSTDLAEAVRIKHDGSVGIGADPSATLHVNKTGVGDNEIVEVIRLSTLNSASPSWSTTDGLCIGAEMKKANGTTITKKPIKFRYDGGDMATTFDEGKVGIGATVPSEALHVAGNGRFGSYLSVNTSGKYQTLTVNGNIWLPGSTGQITWSNGDVRIKSHSGYHMSLDTYDGSSAAVENLRLKSGGNVGVNAISDPSASLHVGGSAIVGRTNDTGSYPNDDYDFFVGNGNSGTRILLYNNSGAYHSGLISYDTNCLKLGLNNSNSADSLLTTTAVNITNTGVGIGCTPSAKLHVNGDSYFASDMGIGMMASSTYRLSVSDTGNSPVQIQSTSNNLNLTLGSSTQTQYTNILMYSNSGDGQIWKAGGSYSGYGGASSLNIYCSNGKIAFHPGANQNEVVIHSDGDVDIAENLGVGGAHSGSHSLYVTGTSYFNGRTTLGAAGATEGGAVINYAAFGEIKGGLQTMIGNAVVPGTANNTIQHSKSDAGNYIRMVYSEGIAFHTNITNTVNTDVAVGSSNERMRIDLNGRVGIGTATPHSSSKLHVNGKSRFDGTIIANVAESDTVSYGGMLASPLHFYGAYCAFRQATNHSLNLDVYNGGTVKTAWTVLQDGNVGIGETSPEGLLSFKADESDTPKIRFQNQHSVTTDAAISTYDDSSGTTVLVGSNLYIASSGATTRFNTGEQSAGFRADRGGLLQFYTGEAGATASERIRVAADGKVGIGGVTSPDGTLHVHTASAGTVTADADRDDLVIENSTNVGLTFLSPNTTKQAIAFGDPENSRVGLITYDHADNSLAVRCNNTDNLLKVTSTGVGVNCTPGAKLQIGTGNVRLTDDYYLEWGGTKARIGGSNSGDYVFISTDNTDRFRIASNGKVTFQASQSAMLYAAEFRRSGSNLSHPDIWDDNNHGIVIGHNSSTPMLKVTSTGVGVGVTPSAKLHVVASSDDGIRINSNNAIIGQKTTHATHGTQLLFWNGTAAYLGRSISGLGSGTVTSWNIRTGGADKVIINSTGLGIGGITPGRALDVDGRVLADTYGFRSDTTVRWYYFDNYSGSNFMGRGGNAYTALYDTGVLSMAWKGGKVGIATVAPHSALDVKEATGSSGQTAGVDTLTIHQVISAWTVGCGPRISFVGDADRNMGGIRSYCFGHEQTGLAFESGTASSTGYAAMPIRMVINHDGKVGIGTTTPASLLDLRNTRAGNINAGTGHTGSVLTLHTEAQWESSYGSGGSTPDFLGGIEFSTGDASTGEGVRAAIRTTVDNYYNTNSLTFHTRSGSAALTERARIDKNGNFGIGTASPSEKLHINNGSSSGAGAVYPLRLSGGDQLSTAGDATGIQFVQRNQYNDYGGYIRLANTQSNPNYLNPRLEFGVQNTDTNVLGSVSTKMVLDGNGRCGINTVSPSARLNVLESANAWTAIIKNTSATGYGLSIDCSANSGNTTYALATYTGSGTGFFVHNTGKVGIGVNDPDSKLEIKGAGGSTGLTLKTTDSSGNTGFWVMDGGRVGVHYQPFVVNQDYNDTDCPSNTYMYVHSASPFTIKNDGKVGIGAGAVSPECDLDLHKAAVGGLRLNIHNSAVETASDASITFETQGQMDWGMGIDRSDSGKFKIGHHPTVGSDTVLTLVPQNNRVGIGTVSPDSKLEIAGGGYNSSLKIKGSGGDTGIQFEDSAGNTDGYIYAEGASLGFLDAGGSWAIQCKNDDYIRFAINGNVERMRISSNSNVSIGSTNSAYGRLFVDATSNVNSAAALAVRGRTSDASYLALNVLNSGDGSLLSVLNDGKATIPGSLGVGGTLSGSYKLYVNGTSYFNSGSNSSPVTLRTSATTGGNYLPFTNTNGQLGYVGWSAGDNDLWIVNQSGSNTGAIHLYAGGSTKVLVASDGDTDITGRLGVGGAHSGSYGLNVHGTSYFGNNIYGADADYLAVFGRARVGYIGHGDYAGFAHRDQSTTTTYALLQGSSGDTFLNSANGQTIYFRTGNSNVGGIVGGNWGVGTVSPGSYKLYVNGAALVSTNLRLATGTAAGNANDPAITVGGYTNAGVYFESSGVGLGAGTGKFLFLDSNGVVDLGASKLKIGGSSGSDGQVLTTDGSGGISWTTVSGSGSGSGTVNSGTAEQMAFYASNGTAVSGTSAFTFENSTDEEFNIGNGSSKGELCIGGGVGETSADYRLFVNGGIKFDEELSSESGIIKFQSNETTEMIMSSAGLTVNNSSSQVDSTYALHVSGGIKNSTGGLYVTGDGYISSRLGVGTSVDTSYGIKVAGYIASYGHTTWSDYRLKDNTTLWSTSEAATLVKDVPVYSYRWNDNCEAKSVQDQDRIGFLAHEVSEKINKNNLVINEKDGEKYQSVNQTDMIPILWAALQDALKRIEELEAR